MKQLTIAIIGTLILYGGIQTTTTHAEEQTISDRQETAPTQRRGPPAEAFAACEGKSAGASAELTTPRGDTLAGTCETDQDGKLALRPDRAERNNNRRQGPPPEAYAACEGKSAGDSSQLTTPRGETLNGTCEADREGKLVLRPEHLGTGRR